MPGTADIHPETAKSAAIQAVIDRLYDPCRCGDHERSLRIARASLGRFDVTHANLETLLNELSEDALLALVERLDRRLPSQREALTALAGRLLSA